MEEQKRCSKTIDVVSYALKVSVHGVTCVTGNNLVVHKALVVLHVKLCCNDLEL